MEDLKKTPLHALHLDLGARMVPFAGYEMPVQYPLGVMKEHLHTRAAAGLFDVSHMGQVLLDGSQAAAELEALVPQSLLGLEEGRQRYAFFTHANGGILDDLMVANRGDHLFLVVNAACKVSDVAHLRRNMALSEVIPVTDRALLALQGPAAEAALGRIVPVAEMRFMDVSVQESDYGELWISRSGYTGEDGFEVSVHEAQAEAFARALLEMEEVEPIGLGARDSLRLEAGLCLYGHDIDTTTDPVQAALTWAIQKVRRPSGSRSGGYPGDAVIGPKLAAAEIDPDDTRRVGLVPEGRAPMREGVQLFETEDARTPIGRVTSGAPGPTVGHPVAMGYVPVRLSLTGTQIWGEVRGKRLPARVAPMPFVPPTYKR